MLFSICRAIELKVRLLTVLWTEREAQINQSVSQSNQPVSLIVWLTDNQSIKSISQSINQSEWLSDNQAISQSIKSISWLTNNQSINFSVTSMPSCADIWNQSHLVSICVTKMSTFIQASKQTTNQAHAVVSR